MRTADIKRFAGRDWQRLSASKREWWAGRSAEERFRVADALREHMRAVRPDWPSPAERKEDLEAHIRLARLFRAVSVAFFRGGRQAESRR